MAEELFVVAVASEKGGVGKTTIATNLAVYLKALREDLPVTIASFDNHFSVDNMFAIGRHLGHSVAGLFQGLAPEELLQLGEYGVQFLASERQLTPPDEDHLHLQRRLGASGLRGILVLDTRPILDYFTRNALLASDLVLVPVKDRASLVNAAALRGVLSENGRGPERLWLVPSLVDGRLRLADGSGMHRYLAFSGQERGFQVFDGFISKSPKVEGLASGFSSRIHPVLTHARGTLVHRQLRTLAEFVLQNIDGRSSLASQAQLEKLLEQVPAGRLRRLLPECPVCCRRADGLEGELFLDLRSRRRGFVHGECFSALLGNSDLQTLLSETGLVVVQVTGRGLAGGEGSVRLTMFDAAGEEQLSEKLGRQGVGDMEGFLCRATGRQPEEWLQETLLLTLGSDPPAAALGGEGAIRFAGLRRSALRELAGV